MSEIQVEWERARGEGILEFEKVALNDGLAIGGEVDEGGALSVFAEPDLPLIARAITAVELSQDRFGHGVLADSGEMATEVGESGNRVAIGAAERKAAAESQATAAVKRQTPEIDFVEQAIFEMNANEAVFLARHSLQRLRVICRTEPRGFGNGVEAGIEGSAEDGGNVRAGGDANPSDSRPGFGKKIGQAGRVLGIGFAVSAARFAENLDGAAFAFKSFLDNT